MQKVTRTLYNILAARHDERGDEDALIPVADRRHIQYSTDSDSDEDTDEDDTPPQLCLSARTQLAREKIRRIVRPTDQVILRDIAKYAHPLSSIVPISQLCAFPFMALPTDGSHSTRQAGRTAHIRVDERYPRCYYVTARVLCDMLVLYMDQVPEPRLCRGWFYQTERVDHLATLLGTMGAELVLVSPAEMQRRDPRGQFVALGARVPCQFAAAMCFMLRETRACFNREEVVDAANGLMVSDDWHVLPAPLLPILFEQTTDDVPQAPPDLLVRGETIAPSVSTSTAPNLI